MRNPFAGPRPIGQSEPIFGRDREITELRHLLISERLVLLHAPSGAGKTSLINAGLIPEFAVNFAVCPPTRVIFEMPGAYYSPVSCSTQIGGSPDPGESLEDISLHDFIARLPKDKNKLLILDHFEYTVRAALANPGWHTGFFRQLGQLLNDPSIWALISLREDFVAPILPLLEYIPTRLRARYRLDFLSRAQAELAMRKTAATSQTRVFAEAAAARLAETLSYVNVQNLNGTFTRIAGDAVEPLQLQVVCRRLWDAIPEDDLSIDPVDIETFGDVNAALGAYYTQSIDTLAKGDPLRQRAIREWFEKNLITPGGIRGQVRRGHGQSEGLENTVIEQLLETHLVRAELRGTVTWYELAHDSLVAPVLASNKSWYDANLSPCQRRAAIWLANDKADAFLLTGDPLAEAELWHNANFYLVTTDEYEFLEKSQQKQAALDHEADLRRRLVHTTVNAELERVHSAPDPGAALAHLAYALRVQPESLVVRARIFDLLQRSAWWLPFAPLHTSEPIQCTAINRDGSLALAGNNLYGGPPFTRVWDTQTGEPVANQPQIPHYVTDGFFSPDGRFLLVFADPPGAYLYDLTQIPSTPIYLPLSGVPDRALFSPDSRRVLILTGPETPSATLWNPATVQPVSDPIPNVLRAIFSPDSTKFLTRFNDNSAQVWDASAGQPVGSPITHADPILHGIFSPDSVHVLTTSQQTQVHVWPEGHSVPHQTPAKLARISDDTALLASVHDDGLHVSSLRDESVRLSPIPLPAPPLNLNFTSDNRALTVVVDGPAALVFDPSSGRLRGKPIADLRRHNASFHPAKPHLIPAARHRDGTAEIGFLATGLELAGQLQQPRTGHLAAWSPDGQIIALAAGNGVHHWAAKDGSPSGEPIVHATRIIVLAFSPDGTRLLTASQDGVVRINPGPQFIFPFVTHAEWSTDGAQIRTTAFDQSVSIWDAATGAELAVPPAAFPDGDITHTIEYRNGKPCLIVSVNGASIDIPHSSAILSVEVSTSRLSVLTRNEDNETQVWCAITGARIGQAIRSEMLITSARFSPSGTFVLTTTSDGQVQLWDALSGLPATMPFCHADRVEAAAFSPDSARLLVAGPTVPARVYAIYGNDDPALLAQLAEAVGGQTLNVHDAVIPLPDQHAALRAFPRETEWIRNFLPD